MKLIIDIDEDRYKDVIESQKHHLLDSYAQAVANGTPIPNNASNGDVIKAMFDVKEIDMSNTYCVHFPEEEDYSHYFFKGWWNSPYQKGGK